MTPKGKASILRFYSSIETIIPKDFSSRGIIDQLPASLVPTIGAIENFGVIVKQSNRLKIDQQHEKGTHAIHKFDP